MAGVRHAFVSRDPHPVAAWQKVGRHVDCLAYDALQEAAVPRYDLVWIHTGAAPASVGHLELVRRIAAVKPCVVLADVPSDRDALAAFAAGARGYCNSHAQPRVLKLVSEVVLQGGLWVGESLLRRLVTGVAGTLESGAPAPAVPAASSAHPRLSAREREVAEAIAAGASNKEVARRLGIAERTVKAHVSTIFDKLDVKDRLQLALKIIALRNKP